MSEGFGDRLRQQRERQQIALSTIAAQTKIKLSLLQDLERDDVSHWPTGIFRRAFIRAYAHSIGLDQDTVVREFLETHPEPAEIVETDPALSPPEAVEQERVTPPIRLRYLVDSAIDALSRLGRQNASKPMATERLEQLAALARSGGAPPSGVEEGHYVEPVRAAPEPADIPEPHGRIGLQTRIDQPGAAEQRPKPPLPRDGETASTTAEKITESTPDAASVELVEQAPAAPGPTVLPAVPLSSEGADLPRLARLCTELARVGEAPATAVLLQEAADVLDAVGLVVWAWDPDAGELRAAMAHGYSEKVLAHLPRVRPDGDNATAAAFRSGQCCVVRGGGTANGALAVPTMSSSGCVGVLALEVRCGSEDQQHVRAQATIVAAQLARLVESRSRAADRRGDLLQPPHAGGNVAQRS